MINKLTISNCADCTELKKAEQSLLPILKTARRSSVAAYETGSPTFLL